MHCSHNREITIFRSVLGTSHHDTRWEAGLSGWLLSALAIMTQGEKQGWVDEWTWLTLLSSSRICLIFSSFCASIILLRSSTVNGSGTVCWWGSLGWKGMPVWGTGLARIVLLELAWNRADEVSWPSPPHRATASNSILVEVGAEGECLYSLPLFAHWVTVTVGVPGLCGCALVKNAMYTGCYYSPLCSLCWHQRYQKRGAQVIHLFFHKASELCKGWGVEFNVAIHPLRLYGLLGMGSQGHPSPFTKLLSSENGGGLSSMLLYIHRNCVHC